MTKNVTPPGGAKGKKKTAAKPKPVAKQQHASHKRKRKATIDEMARALEVNRGIVTLAAHWLTKKIGDKVTPRQLRYAISKSDRLREVAEEANEELIDIAEGGIWKLLEATDGATIRYVLSTKGAHRGWIKPQDLNEERKLDLLQQHLARMRPEDLEKRREVVRARAREYLEARKIGEGQYAA